MLSPAKLLLVLLAASFGLVTSLVTIGRNPDPVEAAPQVLNVAVQGSTLVVTYRVEDDINNPAPLDSAVTLTGVGGGGTFTTAGSIPASGGGTTCQPFGANTQTLTYTDPCVDGVDPTFAEDIQPPAPAFITSIWQCIGGEVVTFSLTQLEGNGAFPTTLQQQGQCPAIAGSGLITVVASPNALICGGQSKITALISDSLTGVGTPAIFHFTTDNGLIVKDTNNTATLALLPAQGQATVTASTIGIPLGGTTPAVLTGSVVITNHCSNNIPAPNTQTMAIAITASPNVVTCGGTSKITATARDSAGNIIPNLGWHFSTDTGGIITQPNNASNTSGTVDLTITPGMGRNDDGLADTGLRAVVVTASVGNIFNTVKVQQFCPGVDIDSSVAPGRLVVVPAQNTLQCNGSTFIGVTVRDSKGQVPRSANAQVRLLASAGGFIAPELNDSTTSAGTASVTTVATPTNGNGNGNGNGDSGGSSQPTTQAVQQSVLKAAPSRSIQATTNNGSLNVIYVADAYTNGEVQISVAAGTAFGNTVVTVNCPFASAAAGSRPPGSPLMITPPNTGDAGIR